MSKKSQIKDGNYVIPVIRYISFNPKKLSNQHFGEVRFEHSILSGVIETKPNHVSIEMKLNLEIPFSIEKMRKIVEEYDRSKLDT